MNVIWKHCIRTTLVAVACVGNLSAQSGGVDVAFKLRSGVALSQPKDHLARKTLGFGLALGLDTGVGRFSAELGYQYKPGDQYLEDVTRFPVAGGAPAPDVSASVDSRKTKLEGIMLRLAYGTKLGSALSWHAGVQVGGSKFRQEYVADVADANWATYEDTYGGVVNHSALAVSPFAGLAFPVSPSASLEVNVLGLRYTSATYVHVAGTVSDWGAGHTTKDSIAKETRLVPHLELAYAIRF